MIKIRLDTDLYLTSDSHQYTLSKTTHGGPKPISFYQNIEGVLQGVLDLKLRNSDSVKIADLLDVHVAFSKKMIELLKPLKVENAK